MNKYLIIFFVAISANCWGSLYWNRLDTTFYLGDSIHEIVVCRNHNRLIISEKWLLENDIQKGYEIYLTGKCLDSILVVGEYNFNLFTTGKKGRIETITNAFGFDVYNSILKSFDECNSNACKGEFGTQFLRKSSMMVHYNCCNREIDSIEEIKRKENLTEVTSREGIRIGFSHGRPGIIQIYEKGKLSGIEIFFRSNGRFKLFAVVNNDLLTNLKSYKELNN